MSLNQHVDLRIGPFTARVETPIPGVRKWIVAHYAQRLLPEQPDFFDFHIRVTPPIGLRRWWRPQVLFESDGERPFKPLPASQAYALFEWGLNWCIAQFAHHYLVIHAAVVATSGRALILPGQPGSGKSTLCAALLADKWRLLSDEFALVSLDDGALSPLPRPISLKDKSIDLIRELLPDADIGPIARDTVKGTVAHLAPPIASVQGIGECPLPYWLVFPVYDPDSPETALQPLTKGRALLAAAESSFNYNILGADGFRAMADLVDRCDCYTLTYPDLSQARASIDGLTETARIAST